MACPGGKRGNWKLRRAAQRVAAFGPREDGAATIEAIIITPVVLIFLAGILEFGAFMYNKVELETGLRDAARYLARCRDNNGDPIWDPIVINPSSPYGCDFDTAKNLAVYGEPDPAGDATPRVTGWNTDDVTFEDVEASKVSNPVDANGQSLYRGGEYIYIVRVSTEIDYPGGTLLDMIGIDTIPMTAYHEERYIGW